jgi:hypothetical protein
MPAPYDMPDAELEEIVAYLDGELASDAAARVERRLSSDEDFRQELQGIERAWHALDELPMATVDDRFSRTTMSLVIEAANDELKHRAAPMVRWRRWASSAVAAGVAAALGFLAFRLAWHDPNAPLVADLAVIDNVDLYGQFRDVDFLRDLQVDLGPELQALSGDPLDLKIRRAHFAAVALSDDGAEWLAQLNPDERTHLRAKFNRFRELSAEEQARRRELHRAIIAEDDSAELQRTMLAYQQWLGSLSPGRQFELREMDDAEERIAQIRKWADEMRDDELLTLTDDELKALFNDLRPSLGKLLQSLPRQTRREDSREQLKVLMASEFGYGPFRRELAQQFAEGGQRDWFLKAVLAALPERSQDRFASLSPGEKVERFLTWTRQHTTCRGELTQQDLETFFAEELSPEEQAQLLTLPTDEMEQALRMMFRCQPKSAADGSLIWQAGGRGDGFGAGPKEEGRSDGGGPRGRRGGRDERRDDSGPPRSFGGRGGPGGPDPGRRGFGGPPGPPPGEGPRHDGPPGEFGGGPPEGR